MLTGGEDISPADLSEAREWLDWQAVGHIAADARSDEWVIAAVRAFYPGGWPAFLQVVAATQVDGVGDGLDGTGVARQ